MGDSHCSQTTSSGMLCFCGDRTYVTNSWMCKEQTAVSHSNTEADMMSVDAHDCEPKVCHLQNLWDCVVDVFTPVGSDSTNTVILLLSDFSPLTMCHPTLKFPANVLICSCSKTRRRPLKKTHRVHLDWQI